jgi:hypothetical protein
VGGWVGGWVGSVWVSGCVCEGGGGGWRERERERERERVLYCPMPDAEAIKTQLLMLTHTDVCMPDTSS